MELIGILCRHMQRSFFLFPETCAGLMASACSCTCMRAGMGMQLLEAQCLDLQADGSQRLSVQPVRLAMLTLPAGLLYWGAYVSFMNTATQLHCTELSLSPVGHDRADFMLYAQIISSCCHPDGLAMVSPDVSCFRLQYAGW